MANIVVAMYRSADTITTIMFMVLRCCHRSLEPLREFTRFIWWIWWIGPLTLRPCQTTQAVSPPVGCQKPHPPSPFIIITQPESWYSFYHPTEVEGGVDLGTAVRLCSPCPRLYIVVVFFTKNLQLPTVGFEPWSSHTAVRHRPLRPAFWLIDQLADLLTL